MLQDPNSAAVPQPPLAGEPETNTQQPVQPPGPPEKQLLQNPEFLWTVGLLALVMIGGAIAIGILDRWRKRQVDPARWKRSGPELSSFRDMLDSGEITHSEYEKIRDKMANKMKMEVGLKKPTPPSTPEAPPTVPPTETPGSSPTT
jgi:hypothetical protein